MTTSREDLGRLAWESYRNSGRGTKEALQDVVDLVTARVREECAALAEAAPSTQAWPGERLGRREAATAIRATLTACL